jgi:hypothetical protein
LLELLSIEQIEGIAMKRTGRSLDRERSGKMRLGGGRQMLIPEARAKIQLRIRVPRIDLNRGSVVQLRRLDVTEPAMDRREKAMARGPFSNSTWMARSPSSTRPRWMASKPSWNRLRA